MEVETVLIWSGLARLIKVIDFRHGEVQVRNALEQGTAFQI